MESVTPVIPAELNIFSNTKIQNAILGDQIVACKPVNALTLPLSTLEFASSGSNETYRDLSQTFLRLKVCLRAEDGMVPIVDQEVACVNNLLYSLFQTLEVYLGGKLVCREDYYGYKSYVESLLNFSAEAARTHLTSAMFYLDTPGEVLTAGDANEGFRKRKSLLAGGRSCELYGRVRCGLFNQPLLLPQGLDLRVKFTFAPESFYMWGAEGADVLKLHIQDASLYTRNVILSPPLLLSHARILAQTNAVYPMKRVECKAFTVPPGSRNITLNSVSTGRLPSFLCCAMLENSTFNGNRHQNSFAFVHKSVTSVSIFVNSLEHKIGPMDFNSTNSTYAFAYYSLFASTGADSRPTPHMITPEMFSHGTFLVCKDLTPDASGNTGHSNIPNSGEVRIELTFAVAIETAVTCLVLLEYDATLEIDSSRNILIA